MENKTQRAWSTLEIKSVTESAAGRMFEGVASTPETDRQGDIVDPMGAKFTLPIPLLWQHDASMPIGSITEAKATKNGITVKGRVENLSEPASLKEDLDRAWAMMKAKLVKGLSIGFMPIESEPLDAKNPWGGQRFLSWDWLELSAVTIAANAGASITQIKSVDQSQMRAASGTSREVKGSPPGATGTQVNISPTSRGSKVKTYQEQIASSEATRAANVARMGALMDGAAEKGTTLDETETQEYDGLEVDVKKIDGHLVRLKNQAKLVAETATPVTPEDGGDPDKATKARSGVVTWSKSTLAPGIRFARYAMCVAASKGNLMQAEILSRRFNDSSPEVNLVLKTAVAAGTTQDATWAAPLVQLQEMQAEFVEFLRPLTLLGQLDSRLRHVPFNIKFTRQTAGTTGTFVGEGLPKPLGKMDFELLSMTWAKAATIIVMTEELVRFSNPSAETLARDDLAAGIARYLDLRFIDPVYAGVANVSPASITNGITPIASTGTTVAAITTDIATALKAMAAANLNLGGLVWIMNPAIAIDLSLKRTAQDLFAFPNITATGGTFMGYPVIMSNNVALSGSPTEAFVVLLDPSNIMLADDGQVSIDMSTEASLQMSDTPSSSASSMISLWQSNMVALRAERFINWRRRRDTAVQLITMNANW